MSKVQVRKRVQIDFTDDPGLTHQSFKDECDIDNIIKRYRKTGHVAHLTNAEAIYGDFTNVPDYREYLDMVIQAQEGFMALPADIRAKFGNDPAQFIDFVNDANNVDAMIEMGLVEAIPMTNSIKTESLDEAAQSST